MDRKLVVRHLGRVEYEDGLALMKVLAERRERGEIPDTLLLLEHPAVLTKGRGAKAENVLLSDAELEARGVELFETDRGGDVTFHGPGQLVGYAIFDIGYRPDVGRYVRNIEEAIIRALATYGIHGVRAPKWTGVWIGEKEDPASTKICAIGVHIKRWITTHGFALNVLPDLKQFEMIIPCGISERGVDSISHVLGRLVPLEEVAPIVAEKFGEVFGWQVEERGFDLRTISVALLREGAQGPEALLLRRTPARGGFLQIVTGRIEEGEAPAAAAARELAEETGLHLPVQDLRYVHSFGFGEEPLFVQEHAFAAWAQPDAAIRLDPAEHVEASWVSAEEALRALPFKGLKRAVERALADRR